MCVQNKKLKSSNQTLLRFAPKVPTETWDIQLPDGSILWQMNLPTIARGLQEGWLGLDDPARKAGEIAWRPIREALKASPEGRGVLDPSYASGRKFGSGCGALLGWLSLGSVLIFSWINLFDFPVGLAIGIALVMTIAGLIIRANPVGVAVAMFGIGYIGVLLMGLDVNILDAILGFLFLETLVTVGEGIGYAVGFLIGAIVGSGRSKPYQIPARQPVPEEIQKEFSQKGPGLFDRPEVVNFYTTTLEVWASGRLNDLSLHFAKVARQKSLEAFVKVYPPVPGQALYTFLSEFSPQPGEFLVEHRADSFVLTNFRLVQKNGEDNIYYAIPLAEVRTYERRSSTLKFEMETGQVFVLSKIKHMPNAVLLKKMIERAKQAQC